MLSAVEVFGVEGKGSEAQAAGLANEGAGRKTFDVAETEYRIQLPASSSQTLKAGTYVFHVTNKGKQAHNLVVDGPGVPKRSTPNIQPGASADLRATLRDPAATTCTAPSPVTSSSGWSRSSPSASRAVACSSNGEGGIRTLDGGIHPHNALAGRRLQPLGHFSGAARIAQPPATKHRRRCPLRGRLAARVAHTMCVPASPKSHPGIASPVCGIMRRASRFKGLPCGPPQGTPVGMEGWQSGRMRRSRKPLSVVRRIEGSNPSPSALYFARTGAR